jgi:tetratricopeptide (TPR) repeat protein
MHSTQAEDLFARGHDHLHAGRYEEALACFDVLIELCPEMVGAWGNRGYALYELARDAEALSSFGQVIALDPDDPFGHGYRALALYNLGRFSEAFASAVRALDLADDEDDCPPARQVRALLFVRAGQFASAVEDLDLFFRYSEDESLEPLFELCRRVDETGDRSCPDGPGGVLDCTVCLCSACGFSFDRRPNPDWRDQDGRCPYSHCIELMPHRDGSVPEVCPYYYHDCPGGAETVRSCELAAEYMGERSDLEIPGNWLDFPAPDASDPDDAEPSD